MAITQSPTRMVSLSPKLTKGKGVGLSTFRSAMSVLVSRPTSVAFSRWPEKNSISISSAPSMTWLFVTI